MSAGRKARVWLRAAARVGLAPLLGRGGRFLEAPRFVGGSNGCVLHLERVGLLLELLEPVDIAALLGVLLGLVGLRLSCLPCASSRSWQPAPSAARAVRRPAPASAWRPRRLACVEPRTRPAFRRSGHLPSRPAPVPSCAGVFARLRSSAAARRRSASSRRRWSLSADPAAPRMAASARSIASPTVVVAPVSGANFNNRSAGNRASLRARVYCLAWNG